MWVVVTLVLRQAPKLREREPQLEAKKDKPTPAQQRAEGKRPVGRKSMHLVEVFHEQGLICERQPLRITEKGRANHHHLRAHRDKGAAKEKAAVTQEEVI